MTIWRARLADRIIASRAFTAELLVGLFVSRKRVSLAVAAAPAEGADKDAVKKGNRLGRRTLLRENRQYLRLRAGPQLLNPGRVPEPLPLCTERNVSVTTIA